MPLVIIGLRLKNTMEFTIIRYIDIAGEGRTSATPCWMVDLVFGYGVSLVVAIKSVCPT